MLKRFTSAIKGRKVTHSNSSRDLRTERKSWVPCRKETKRYHNHSLKYFTLPNASQCHRAWNQSMLAKNFAFLLTDKGKLFNITN